MEDCGDEYHVLWSRVCSSQSHVLAPSHKGSILNVIFTAHKRIIFTQLSQFFGQGLDAKILLALTGQLRGELLHTIPCDSTRRGVLKIVAQKLSMLNSLLNILGTELRPTSRARVLTLLGHNFESCAHHR